MVFFTCNACGQAVKKNQVEKHYTTKCRNCSVLSCIDCGKEFRGDEYQSHVKCISENEKYGGKDFKPKPSSAKGETKQANWITNIKNYIAVTNLPQKLSSLLNSLVQYDNIPRKKKSFENFLINSVRVRDKMLSEQVWEVFMKANQPEDSSKAAERNESSTESKPNKEKPKDENNATECPMETEKHKKKRKNNEEEMQSVESELQAENLKSVKKRKKHHRDKVDEAEHVATDNLAEDTDTYSERTKKSKKRKEHALEENLEKKEHSLTDETTGEMLINGKTKKKHKKKKKGDTDLEASEIDYSAESEKSPKESGEAFGNVYTTEDTVVSSNDINKLKKKKKHKKYKNEDLENGNEDTITEELNSKRDKIMHGIEENHNGENEISQPVNCEENIPKKKKKKCK